jgi:nitroreductase/dihydropteridine reductase
MSILIDKMNWRYATKKFDAAQTVPLEKIERILEAVRLAPTSSGLQPFELLVVTNPALRVQIKAIGYDQQQITDCSRLLVFAAWDDRHPSASTQCSTWPIPCAALSTRTGKIIAAC